MSGLEAIIENESDARSGCAGLVDYLEVYVSRGRRNITDELYQNAPRILTKLFGSAGAPGWVHTLAGQASSSTELRSIYDLLAPKSTRGGHNLFNLMMAPPFEVPPYTVPISIFPPLTQHLIESKGYHLLSSYFHNLSEKPERQRQYLDEGRIALYPQEYYLTIFLYALKEQTPASYLGSLLDLEQSLQAAGNTQDTRVAAVMEQLLVRNPLFMLFTQYVASLAAQSRSHSASVSAFDFFLMAIDELWLSEVYNAEKLRPLGSTRKPPYTDPLKGGIRSAGALVLDCLYALFGYLQHQAAFPSLEGRRRTRGDGTGAIESNVWEGLKDAFYQYLKQTFRGWNEASGVLDVGLHDVASLWLYFVTPWDFSPLLEEIFYNYDWPEYYPSDFGIETSPICRLKAPAKPRAGSGGVCG